MNQTMALFYCSINTPRHAYLLFLLLLLSSMKALHLTEGRPFLKPQEVVAKDQGEEMAMVGVETIGSRPPRCEGRCLSCGQCEAVQVPAVPQEKSGTTKHASIAAITTSRGGDDNSIYKPLSWKCKCGGVILNP